MNYYSGHPEYLDKQAHDPSESRTVSELIYGCMDLAGTWNKGTLAEMAPSKAKERIDLTINIIKCCLEHGINFFDHADIYGRGKCEEIFAQAIKQMKVPRDQYILQSKCGIILPDTPAESAYYNFSGDYIVEQVEGSLRRLETDYLDVLLLHRPDTLVCPGEIAEAFTKLQQQGKVLAFGVSNHSSGQITLLQSALPFQLAYNQIEISLMHNQLLSAGLEFNTKNAAAPYVDTVDYCRLNDIRLQAWAPVSRGKIFYSSDAGKPKTRLQSALEQFAQAKNCSPGVDCYRMVAAPPGRNASHIGYN